MPVQFDRNSPPQAQSDVSLGAQDAAATTIIARIQNSWLSQIPAQAAWPRRDGGSARSPNARSMSARERRELLIVLFVTMLVVTLAAVAGFGVLGLL
jgi:hypothetical protein